MEKIRPVNIIALYEIIKEKKLNVLHEEFLERYRYLRFRNDKEVKCWLMCTTRKNNQWTYKIRINEKDCNYLTGYIEKLDGNRLLGRTAYYGGV